MKSFEMRDDEDVENDWGKAVLPTSYSKSPPLDRQYSTSTMVPQAEVSKNRMTNHSAKVQKLKDRVSDLDTGEKREILVDKAKHLQFHV